MGAPVLEHVQTFNPVPVALASMGKAAREAARTWTMQEWAARLATRAGPRDYLGQLRKLYEGVLDRWRYVMESGERVPGTGRALLRYVLGTEYNAGEHCPTYGRCDVLRTKWKERGWGDCDDVSALVAAGVLALGMRPVFRVVIWPTGGHVGVVAFTPKGERVSIDPVGHPEHGFGWAMRPPGGRVLYFDLDGKPLRLSDGTGTTSMGKILSVPRLLSGDAAAAVMGGGADVASSGAYLSGMYMGMPELGRAHNMRLRVPAGHVALVRPGDTRGRRILTISPRAHNIFRRGMVMDRARAFDQFGDAYEYLGGSDVWAPLGRWEYDSRNNPWNTRADDYADLAGPGSRRARRRARRKRRRAKVRKFFKKVVKGLKSVVRWTRKMLGRVLKSKAVRVALSAALAAFGVPARMTRSLLAAAGKVLARTGKPSEFMRALMRGRFKKAARIGAQMLRKAGKLGNIEVPPDNAAKQEMRKGFEEDEADRQAGRQWVMVHDGATYTVAPVMGMVMGDVAESPTIEEERKPTAKPIPGKWYRVQKGDRLLSIAGKAYGLPSGGARLAASKRINAIKYNARFLTKKDTAFSKKHYPNGSISMAPVYACDPATQHADATDGGRGQGQCRPLIYIPIADEEPPPLTSETETVEPTDEPTPTPVPAPPEPPPKPVEEEPPPKPATACPANHEWTLAKKSDGTWKWFCTPTGYTEPVPPPTPPAPEPTPPPPEPPEPEPPEPEPEKESCPEGWVLDASGACVPGPTIPIPSPRPPAPSPVPCAPGTYNTSPPGFAPKCVPVVQPPPRPKPGPDMTKRPPKTTCPPGTRNTSPAGFAPKCVPVTQGPYPARPAGDDNFPLPLAFLLLSAASGGL